ncbi:interleukin-6-like [Carcharodon carcharias]|uniref:interleukin-6-like n=1 Tax=Carcharodon carcharias TaxID=13397 RepID=UPI001B7E2482|nr:interleukin-6-like [Carcharodon carcharias]
MQQAILGLVMYIETGLINDFIVKDPPGMSDPNMIEFHIEFEDLCQSVLLLSLWVTASWMSPVAISPLPESSGDSEDFYVTTETPAAAARDLNLEPLALFIQNIATEQRKRQLCNYFSMCDGATDSLTMYNMELPRIRKKDKCFETNFQKKKCLSNIVKGFQEYKKYLLFVRQWIESDKLQVDAMLSSSKILVDLLPLESKIRERIIQQEKSSEQAFNPDQSSENNWDKQVAIHVILRNFVLFMESTIRTIRFMN